MKNEEFDEITSQIFNIFITHKLNIDMIYFFLNRFTCRYAQILNKNLDEIKYDIEVIFKTLPPPIEENDDNPDQQPNCQGT